MTIACPIVDEQSGAIRGALLAVDCHTRLFAQSGYATLADPSSPFQGWLTALLVIYVAVLGYRLLLGVGRARLSDLTMSALMIGLVLALVSNWATFQTLVFDLASKAPAEVVRLTTSPLRHASSLAANPVSALQYAYDELTRAAVFLGNVQPAAAGQPADGGAMVASAALWRASQALFVSTAGLFCAAIVAVGVLTAVGPLFVALSLFEATRGLFVGWLRALLVAALSPMAGWMAADLMLTVIGPSLAALAEERAAGRLDVDTAMTAASLVLVFAVVQVVLLGAGAVIALGLRLPASGRRGLASEVAHTVGAEDAAPRISRAEALAQALRRQSGAGWAPVEGGHGARGVVALEYPGAAASAAGERTRGGGIGPIDGLALALRRPAILTRVDPRS